MPAPPALPGPHRWLQVRALQRSRALRGRAGVLGGSAQPCWGAGGLCPAILGCWGALSWGAGDTQGQGRMAGEVPPVRGAGPPLALPRRSSRQGRGARAGCGVPGRKLPDAAPSQLSQAELTPCRRPWSPSNPRTHSGPRAPWAAAGSGCFGGSCTGSSWSLPPWQGHSQAGQDGGSEGQGAPGGSHREGAAVGPWEPRGSEGQGLLCCLVPGHPQPQSRSRPSPSPVPVPAPVPVPVSSQFHRSPSPSLSPVPVPVLSQSRPSPAQPSPAPPAGQELTSEPSWWSFRHRKTTKALDGEDGGSAMDGEAKRGKKVSTFRGLRGGQEQPCSTRGAWNEGWGDGGGVPTCYPLGPSPQVGQIWGPQRGVQCQG